MISKLIHTLDTTDTVKCYCRFRSPCPRRHNFIRAISLFWRFVRRNFIRVVSLFWRFVLLFDWENWLIFFLPLFCCCWQVWCTRKEVEWMWWSYLVKVDLLFSLPIEKLLNSNAVFLDLVEVVSCSSIYKCVFIILHCLQTIIFHP
jgi:hypothetical protein